MKRTLLPILVLIALSTVSFAQNVVTDSTATVVGYWKKGDKIKLSYTYSKEKFEGNKSVSKGTSNSIVELTVLEENEKSYVLQWKYSNINVTDTEKNPFVSSLVKITEGLTYKYRTDETGSFIELLNVDEVKKYISKSVEKLLAIHKTNEAIKIASQMQETFSNKEAIELILMKEIQLYHSVYGGEYKFHEKITAETQLPNAITGTPFPATLTVELTDINPASDYCKINMVQTIDKEKGASIIKDILAKISGDKLDASGLKAINVNDSSEFEVELKTGWLKRAYNKREVEALGARNIEIKELKKL